MPAAEEIPPSSMPRRIAAFLRAHPVPLALVLFLLLNLPLVGIIRDALPHRWVKETERHHVKLFIRGEIEKLDSWYPMSMAHDYFLLHGAEGLYDAVFFGGEAKFQYPPSALLLFTVQEWMTPRPEKYVHEPLSFYGGIIKHWVPRLTRWTWWATVATIAVSIALLVLGLREAGRRTGQKTDIIDLGVSSVATGALLLFFYPLVKAFTLGQVQPLIAAGFAIALLCWWFRWRMLAGLLCGIACLLKPQFGILLIWALIRREWEFTAGFLLSAIAGSIFSLLTFGLQAQFDYLGVLSYITHHGEGFYANDSINGLLNRALFNGRNALWNNSEFAPYHPVVYTGTMVSTLLILGLVLWPWKGRNREDRFSGTLDLALCALGATLASPVAWEHHYSLMPPIFVLCFAATLIRTAGVSPAPESRRHAGATNPGRSPVLLLAHLGLSFFLCSHYFDKAVLLADTGWNFLQSYRLAGCLMLLHLAWKLRGNVGTTFIGSAPSYAPPKEA